jgi:transketolase
MEINEKNIKIWSTIGSRATFGLVALDLAKKVENLIILTGDVSTSAGLDRYRKTYPNKYLDTGIAEQNLIGIAAGLASEDYNVLTTTFAPFQTMRCCEQIKVNLGYMKQKVCMVGLASGLALGTLGFTHSCIEDIGVLRSIPGLTIISPADSLETIKSVQEAIKLNGPSYIRLSGSSNNPIVYKKDYKFEIGKAIKLSEGDDITIFCTGTMVFQCIEVEKELKQKNISTSIINVHTIKPIDINSIKEACKSKLIVTVEEHNIIGGLGSAVSENLSSIKGSPKLLSLGVNDSYSKGGEYKYLLNKYGLTSEKIVESILKNFT